MKILVTGDKGFIAKRLISKLDRNFSVFGIDVEDFMNAEDWQRELSSIVSDISPDVIFHVGACSDTLEQDVNYMMKLNYEATKILASYCNYTDCKLIYSSSAANYGSDGKHPSNLYGWSKYAAEDVVTLTGGVALRYFNVYGPGEEHKGRMASVAYQSFLKNRDGETIRLFPKGPTRDFVHVDDIVYANMHGPITNTSKVITLTWVAEKADHLRMCLILCKFHLNTLTNLKYRKAINSLQLVIQMNGLADGRLSIQ